MHLRNLREDKNRDFFLHLPDILTCDLKNPLLKYPHAMLLAHKNVKENDLVKGGLNITF